MVGVPGDGTVQKSVGEILSYLYRPSIVHSNFSSIFTRFRDIAAFVLQNATFPTFPYPTSLVRPPGIPVREFPGIPGNPPLQKFPAGIPGKF